MKGYFLLLNVMAFICVVALTVAHVRHRVPPPSPLLADRPIQPTINPDGVLTHRHAPGEPPQLGMITAKDLFDPARGQAADVASSAAVASGAQRQQLEQLELLGLVQMGELHGAVIQDRAGKMTKKFFKVGGGEDIQGFKLVGVDAKVGQVTLGAGGQEFTLKLDRNSASSAKRRDSVQRQDPKVTLDPGQKPAVAPGGTSPAQVAAAQAVMQQRMVEWQKQRAAAEAARPPEVQKAIETLRNNAIEQHQLRAAQRAANGEPEEQHGGRHHLLQVDSPPPPTRR